MNYESPQDLRKKSNIDFWFLSDLTCLVEAAGLGFLLLWNLVSSSSLL